MYDFFLNSFIALLVIANPLGVSAVFVGLMAHSEQSEIKATAIKAVSVATGLLVFFAFFGEPLLSKLGITMQAFRIAGGLLLFVIAFRMLFGEKNPESGATDQRKYADHNDVAVFPLAIPLISGPGCISIAILLMSEAGNAVEETILLVSIVAVMAVTYGCLVAARGLQKIIGASGNNIIARVMGMILAARSVQFIVDGLQGLSFHSGS